MIKKIIEKIVLNFSPITYKAHKFRKYNTATFSSIEELRLKPEPFLIKYLVEPKKSILDIGCHIGEFIYVGSKQISADHFYAFEPNTSSFVKLKKTFPKSHIYNLAISNKNGILKFKIPEIKGKAVITRGTLEVDFVEQDETDSRINEVQAKTLDTFLNENPIPEIGLIKIDVEGHEMSVIEGAKNTIKKHKPVIIAELEQRHYKENLNLIIDRVKGDFYKCFYFDVRKKAFIEVSNNVESIQLLKYHMVNPALYINNFIFIHVESKLLGKLEQISAEIREK